MLDPAPEQVTPSTAEVRGRFRKGQSGNPAGRPKKVAHRPEPVDQAHVDAWVDGLTNQSAHSSAHADGGWTSLFTGIGTPEHDKRQSYYVEPKRLTYQQIINLWAQDELGERAITAPPAECMRPGYEIIIKDEGNFETLKDQIEDKLVALGADAAIEEAHCLERAFGGGAILLGVKDGRRFDQPLDVANVKSIDWLTVLEPIELYAETYYVDPSEGKYGQPKHYRLNSTVSLTNQFATTMSVGADRSPPPNAPLIHESRLILFRGDRISRYQLFPNLDIAPCWGQSKCVRWVDALRDYHIGYASAGLIANDFSQAVISIDGLMTMLKNEDGKQRFLARLRAVELSKSTARAIVLDTKEKYERQTTSVTGLADLLDRLNKHVAAAIDMPLSLLMGYEGGSLGSENEGDIRFYYDRIRTMTTKKVVPALRTIISIIIQTLRQRKIPKKWSVVFNELWQETEAQKAERKLTDARADSLRIKSGTIYPDESRNRHKGEYQTELQIDPSKKAPGIAVLGPGGTASGGLLAEAKGAPGAAGKTTATGHAVRPYARRNPIQKATPSAKIGGADVPGNRVDGDVVTWRQFAGLAIAVENPKGTTREWRQQDGRSGVTKMRYDYGYIGGAAGADGEEVDCYLGPNEQAEFAYVIHQDEPSGAHLDECLANTGRADAKTSSDFGDRVPVAVKRECLGAIETQRARRSRGGMTTSLQDTIDRAFRNTEVAGNRLDGDASVTHRDGGFQIPETRSAVLSAVLGLAHNRKIGGIVVEAVLIKMVDDLVTPEWASKYTFHHDAMLETLATIVVDQAVACIASESADMAAGVAGHVPHHNLVCPGCKWVYSEDKILLGFDSPNHARDAYIAQYDDARFFGGMSMIKMDELRATLRDESRAPENPITYGDGEDDDRGPA